MMGTGKVSTSFITLIFSVFRTTFQNAGSKEKRRNHFSPTHALPSMPLENL